VSPRVIGVVTSGRADYGICLPVLRRIEATPGLELRLLVTGSHLSAEHGSTISEIERDGWPIAGRVDMLEPGDGPEAIARSMAAGTAGFARLFAGRRPDVLFLPGDRFEVHAAAVAALPFNIPVAHLHGGELSYYSIDDAIRHSLTKLSHLHFVATDEYARRVIQMGEEPWRVTVSGAPGLANMATARRLSIAELEAVVGLRFEPAPLLVTFHPVTRSADGDAQIDNLLAALTAIDRPIVFTMPNADAGGRRMAARVAAFVDATPGSRFIASLGVDRYFSMMSVAAAMVGNSSSGLVEAPSFELPVVNVGDRQAGRTRAANVIDTGYEPVGIVSAMTRACSPEFRAGLRGLSNPYYRPDTPARIVDVLAATPLGERLLVKRFADAPASQPALIPEAAG
jgi:UDP-hydrolysing UDP-N-acetyl-D-glucosamine 2-epimerase